MNTVIFDMDGLLIDSEPIWEEATNEIFATKGLHITHQQYETSIGLRTAEFLDHWFSHFNLDKTLLKSWEELLFESVIYKVKTKGKIMPGVDYIFNFFKERNYKIGLASSSPMSLINAVVEMLDAKNTFQAITSAQDLPYGKPNPQVYLDCAIALQSNPINCICFEDSINGIALQRNCTI